MSLLFFALIESRNHYNARVVADSVPSCATWGYFIGGGIEAVAVIYIYIVSDQLLKNLTFVLTFITRPYVMQIWKQYNLFMQD